MHRSTQARFGLAAFCLVTIAGLVSLAGSAGAQTKISYAGTHLMGWGSGGIPAGNIVGSRTTTIHTSGSVSVTAMVATEGSFMGSGLASATGSNPASVMLPAATPASGLYLVTTTMDPTPPPCCAFFSGTTTLIATSGTFAKNGGNGTFMFTAPGGVGKVTQTAGLNQFGGTLGIVGGFNNHVGFFIPPGIFSGDILQPWAAGYTNTIMNAATFYHTVLLVTSPLTVTLTNFPWTTGKIVVSDTGGLRPTVKTRTGYDNRNAAGTLGTLQVVTPSLAHGSGFTVIEASFASIMRLQFLPEPGVTLMLGVGILGLVGLELLKRRRGVTAPPAKPGASR